jgi:hypothetical protein
VASIDSFVTATTNLPSSQFWAVKNPVHTRWAVLTDIEGYEFCVERSDAEGAKAG